MNLQHWATKHDVSAEGMHELYRMFGIGTDAVTEADTPEAQVQNEIRLEASRMGGRLWRNNVGAGRLDNGSFLRWGICNDTKALNKTIKSSDLIGIRPRLIVPGDVGLVLGQFWAVEVKAGRWKYRGAQREQAQLKFIELVNRLGGSAQFANSIDTL